MAEYLKAELPDYGVFDETRYFQPQADATVFTVAGVRCALLICEDTWLPAAPARARTAGAELVGALIQRRLRREFFSGRRREPPHHRGRTFASRTAFSRKHYEIGRASCRERV